MTNNKEVGRIGIAKAITYYTESGFTISLPLNDTQWYDLIIEKDAKIEFVQCKATITKKNTIDLRGTGGTNGAVYDHVFDHPVDRLFCVDSNKNMFDITIQDMKDFNKNMNSITLNTAPAVNGQGFQTYKYLVH